MPRHVVLARRPHGMPTTDDFALVESSASSPRDGEFTVHNVYLSVDPYMRGRMREAPGYRAAFELNEPMEGAAVGVVTESRNRRFPVGATVWSMNGWRETFVTDGRGVETVDTSLAPLSAYLGAIGVTGFTAWHGLLGIGQPKEGETLVVSAAAGAVGSVVGQIGKIVGCRVVGIAGSDEKCDYLTDELGFDAAINYKTVGDLQASLRAACPNGIDIYFENVGGKTLEAVLSLINLRARIPICGMISQYNLEHSEPGPSNLTSLIGNRVLMQGYIISDQWEQIGAFRSQMSGWLRDGKVRSRETVVQGIENAPQAFIDMMGGRNIGKMLVQVGDDSAGGI